MSLERFSGAAGRTSFGFVFVAVLFMGFGAFGQEGELAPSRNPTHRFEEVAKGVYFVTSTGSVYVMSNCFMIEGDRDVMMVDSHVTPAAARALIKAVKSITNKPVRYLVNTHYHFDHAHGNQAFPEGVDIIGHEYTREKLSGDVLSENTFLSFTQGLPEMLEGLKERIAAESDANAKKALQTQLKIQSAYVKALKELDPTPPNVTFDSRMSMFYGGREIQFLFLGRGHTGGDVVVHLPEEKIAFTGDLMLPFLSYMGDGFVDEWPETLEGLKSLGIETIYPGHGGPFSAEGGITNFQSYLKDLWVRVEKSKDAGLSAEEAAEKIDMSDHGKNYPQIRGAGVDPRAVVRIYRRLEEAGK